VDQAKAAERVLVLTTERDECNDKLAKARDELWLRRLRDQALYIF
jgi:hypothetical protein